MNILKLLEGFCRIWKVRLQETEGELQKAQARSVNAKNKLTKLFATQRIGIARQTGSKRKV